MMESSRRNLLIAAGVVVAVAATFVIGGMWTAEKRDRAIADIPSHAVQASVEATSRKAAPDIDQAIRDLPTHLRAHVDSLANAGGHASRVVFTEGNRWSVEYVLAEMRRSTDRVAADTFYVKRRGGSSSALVNPTATIQGESDSLLVICAHLDASASRDPGWNGNWSRMHAPGADDDGTGIAAMLEALALTVASGTRPHYTLMFVACNAEERNPDYAGLPHRDGHHLGSRHLASSLAASRRPVKGVIAMDMVGWNPRSNFMYLFASDRGQTLARSLAARNASLGSALTLPTTFTPCPNSDNESFDRFGIPAVLFMESCKPWVADAHHPRNTTYHSSRDLPGGVTYPILTGVARLVYSFVTAGGESKVQN
jgi:hypothetical protein